MKNNVLSAFVVFFAVVACLLILDDLSHNMNNQKMDASEVQTKIQIENTSNLVSLDSEIDD